MAGSSPAQEGQIMEGAREGSPSWMHPFPRASWYPATTSLAQEYSVVAGPNGT
jgi:hypothetical protein